jgi:predicted nucleotidyltransferase
MGKRRGVEMTTIEELKARLDRAKDISNLLDRRMWVLAVITQAVADLGVRPIVVGGSAVELYTLQDYATHDVDVVMPVSPEIAVVLEKLGFGREGRYWVHKDTDVLLEMPSDSLAGDLDRVARVEIDDMCVYIIGIEDLVIDRLNACKHWQSQEDCRWAERLVDIHFRTLDWPYLERRAEEEKTIDVLEAIRRKLSSA